MNKLQKTEVSAVKQYLARPDVQRRIKELLDDRASDFMTSVVSMVGADKNLAECEPDSLLMACLTAAALRLSTSKQLGFAHIIPYENKRAGVTEAQFQLGWKGYVQLAQRTGKYKTIGATPVYEGQLKKEDPLFGNEYDWDAQVSKEVIGYVAVMELLNGFKKEIYMSREDMEAHAKQYSKAYSYDLKPTTKYKNSPWSTNFDAMALKTVIKQLISKWGVMSIDLEKAITVDSAVIKEDGRPSYIDGEEIENEKATTDQKSAIIAANKKPAIEAEEITDDDIENSEEAVQGALLQNETPSNKNRGE